jgi:ketose-bisphosphate aldolase
MAREAAASVKVPVALHLDHGTTLESVLRAVDAGYTSVMIDGSHLPLEENIALVRQVVAAVRPRGVTVEAEVGHVAGGVHSAGHDSAPRTDPDEAERLVAETGVDLLAIANGTRHGVFEIQDDIDLELTRELARRVPVPLVQHGTCGIPLALASELAASGMAKINYGEPFRAGYIDHFTEYARTLDHKGHPWKIMQACKEKLKEEMKAIIGALGSAGKA